jgi:1,4-alpha-glucan branching enzyme
MKGSLALALHAHLPFVRHPEHRRSLEETWLFEALTESYIPLLQMLRRLEADGVPGRITFSVTPTLGSMLRDSFLQERYREHLDRLAQLAELETHRTTLDRRTHPTALFYLERLQGIRSWYEQRQGDVLGEFRGLAQSGRVEIMASSATHAVLPLLRTDPGSLRAQITAGRDAFIEMFGESPRGFWLPECAWAGELDPLLAEAGVRWFITESHAVLRASAAPRHGLYAPIITPCGVAAFGRDSASARQVWSREEGYPGDPWYRDFYRDIGFDLDRDYLREFLPVEGRPGFTGIKYHRITGRGAEKQPYEREAALARAREHARHFIEARRVQFERLGGLMDHAVIACPYDAELFGHWWFEGPEFLEMVFRQAHASGIVMGTPGEYLDQWPRHQQAMPADSSWGEQGYWKVWLNEKNHWIAASLGFAGERMKTLAAKAVELDRLERGALAQAARELLLAQASDWPFIIRAGTSPDYAARRVRAHLLRFWKLCDQIEARRVDPAWLGRLERADNILPRLSSPNVS